MACRRLGEDNWRNFSEVPEGTGGRLTGYDGFYALKEMKKEEPK